MFIVLKGAIQAAGRENKDLKWGGAHWVGYRGTRRGMVCDYDHISYAYEILESKENFKRIST